VNQSRESVGGIIAEIVFSCLAVSFALPQHGADIIVLGNILYLATVLLLSFGCVAHFSTLPAFEREYSQS